MDYNKINYQVIEESFLNAESKEYIQQIFEVVAIKVLDSELFVMKCEDLPQSLRSVPKSLSISNDKALIVISYLFMYPFIADSITT